MTIHYNHALIPARSTLPACRIGALGSGADFSRWQATTELAKVTCKTCRKTMASLIELNQKRAGHG
jgi:hypothetical protein